MPVSAGRQTHHTSAQGANYGPHPAAAGASKPMGPSKPSARTHLSPDAAATRIQTAWRSARLARHKPALKQLATASTQLKQLTDQLHAVQRQQPGVPLTQKQYLEMSEPVMKVLFALDAITCGSAVELRTKRKELTTRANKLLDEISAAHKAATVPPPAAAARSSRTRAGAAAVAGSSGARAHPAAAAAAAVAAAAHQQQQQQAQPGQEANKWRKRSWFRS